MKLMSDTPDDLVTYVCEHVFVDLSLITYVATIDDEGALCASCGCEFSTARIIGFGHVKAALPKLTKKPFLKSYSHYDYVSKSQDWVFVQDAKDD